MFTRFPVFVWSNERKLQGYFVYYVNRHSDDMLFLIMRTEFFEQRVMTKVDVKEKPENFVLSTRNNILKDFNYFVQSILKRLINVLDYP